MKPANITHLAAEAHTAPAPDPAGWLYRRAEHNIARRSTTLVWPAIQGMVCTNGRLPAAAPCSHSPLTSECFFGLCCDDPSWT